MTKIKICGLKTLEDIVIVNKYLPEYAGFVFAASKRQVSDEQAKKLKKQLDKRIQTVGVFVNEPQEHIISLYEQGMIDVVQLHGDEDNKYIAELKRKINATVIKAIKVQTSERIKKELHNNADFLLFDTYQKGTYGGSGARFELAILKQILQEDIKKPFFIAGGLAPENIDDVLDKIECYGVDVSSGVETDNKKDKAKVQQFIERVRKR